MTDKRDPSLAAVYAMLSIAPDDLRKTYEVPTRWQCGGWHVVLFDGGNYLGFEDLGRPQIISQHVVSTAVTALQRYRRLSPQQLMSLELSTVGDVVSDEYVLATEPMRDDYGFILEPGAGYRRIVRSIADCTLDHIWSPPAAFAWAKGLSGMGALAEAVDRVRALEALVQED